VSVLETPQHLYARGRRRAALRPRGVELRVEAAVAALFLLTATAIALAFDSPRSLDLFTLVLLVALYVIACQAPFEVADGHTVPTQLVLVPMLFLLPTPLVPLVVGVSWSLGKLVGQVRGKATIHRAFNVFGDCWHAVGPALVLIVAGAQVFAWDEWPVYLLALFAQFAFDFASTEIRSGLLDGTPVREQLRLQVPVYALDGALAPIGLLTAYAAISVDPALCLMTVPMAPVLSYLSRERRARIDQALELSSAYKGTALLLGDVVEADDAYTGSHSRGVVELSVAVGESLGLAPRQLRNVEFAALLHDVGKIAVPKEIINKPGPLDDEEWEVIHRHTIEGEAMLNRVGGVLAEVGRIVRASHEEYGGGGYPDGLAGDGIPIEARIVTCCDAFSAMTTTRAYREAMTPEAAILELRRCAGTQFDPEVARALEQIVLAEGR
jgi:HD-GYP domain-containing protein (c-di-GMP phosphodiesterase class II)